MSYRFCPQCATPLRLITLQEDGGPTERLRCPTGDFTHWNNPTPVLGAIVQCADRDNRVLLARNAAWSDRLFALITGFMESGESPEEGISREVAEETGLTVEALSLVGVYDFQRKNEVIIVYHALARGEIRLSPELAEYELYEPRDIKCWRAGTGYAMAKWLRDQGIEPTFIEPPAQ
jgi:NADH pyrophosphatase NudC (nudix superfamily)